MPGWKSALTSADDEPAPASGSSRPSPDGIESSDESSNPNGNYNFVDGVNVALGPVSRHSPSLEVIRDATRLLIDMRLSHICEAAIAGGILATVRACVCFATYDWACRRLALQWQ